MNDFINFQSQDDDAIQQMLRDSFAARKGKSDVPPTKRTGATAAQSAANIKARIEESRNKKEEEAKKVELSLLDKIEMKAYNAKVTVINVAKRVVNKLVSVARRAKARIDAKVETIKSGLTDTVLASRMVLASKG